MTKEGPLSYKEKTEIPSRQDHEFYRAEAGHASSIRTDFFSNWHWTTLYWTILCATKVTRCLRGLTH